MNRLPQPGNVQSGLMYVRCVNFLRVRLFRARVPLANSYLVRMNNRSWFAIDEAFGVFIIESETWGERIKEREEKKRE